jgi:hypothetical protein
MIDSWYYDVKRRDELLGSLFIRSHLRVHLALAPMVSCDRSGKFDQCGDLDNTPGSLQNICTLREELKRTRNDPFVSLYGQNLAKQPPARFCTKQNT